MDTRFIKIGILLLFVGGLTAFFVLGGPRWLSFDALQSNRALLLDYTQTHHASMLAICALIYMLCTALSIPGAVILSLAMGFLFGRWLGAALIVLAATAGASLVFLAARYLFAAAAQRRMGALGQHIITGFQANALHYLLFLRLVPLFPFWLVNLVPAFTAIKLRTYVLGTAIGIAPGSLVFANLGQSLGKIQSPTQLLSLETLLAFALLGVLALLPVAWKRWRGAH